MYRMYISILRAVPMSICELEYINPAPSSQRNYIRILLSVVTNEKMKLSAISVVRFIFNLSLPITIMGFDG